MRNFEVSMPQANPPIGMDERHCTVRFDSAVEDDDGFVGLARTLDRRRDRGRRVRGDDEAVAVALGDEVVDVRDLRIIVVLGITGLHLGDDAVLLQLLELLVHRNPPGLAPGVGDRGVGEAHLVPAIGFELRGVPHLRVDHLQIGLVLRTLRDDFTLLELLVIDLLVEPFFGRCFLLRPFAFVRRFHGRIGGASRQYDESGRHWQCRAAVLNPLLMIFSPCLIPVRLLHRTASSPWWIGSTKFPPPECAPVRSPPPRWSMAVQVDRANRAKRSSAAFVGASSRRPHRNRRRRR